MKKIMALLFFFGTTWSYIPVITPNGSTLPWVIARDGVKEFHLIAEEVKQEIGPDVVFECWGYNGNTPGPTIEAVEGDRVRIFVTNKLPEATTIHWHGLLLPNGMDGVAGVTQWPIPPGETFVYEFTLRQTGTYMYHPHFDSAVQIGMGLVGFFIIHPKEEECIDRDFAIFLQEWQVPAGASNTNPLSMDSNYFTFNGKIFPLAESLVVKKNQRVRIRFGNLSMISHPIHLHGYLFKITGAGPPIPKSAQIQDFTVDVPVGSTRDIEFVADEEGDWPMHCHKTHHNMSGMDHNLPNMIGVDAEAVNEAVRKVIPNFMVMGTKGMGPMEKLHYGSHLKEPPNFYPPSGSEVHYGKTQMTGMFTIVKVREDLTSYMDPGWYCPPEGTVAEPVNNNTFYQN